MVEFLEKTDSSGRDNMYVHIMNPGGYHREQFGLFDSGGNFNLIRESEHTLSTSWYRDLDSYINQTTHNLKMTNGTRLITQNSSITSAGYFGLYGVDAGMEMWYDNIRVRKYTDPEPTYTVGAEETSPKITRVTATDVYQDGEFLVTSEGVSDGALSSKDEFNWTIELPPGFSLPNNDPDHSNPKIEEDQTWMTSWRVTAPSTTGTYQINVTSPRNKKSQTIDVKPKPTGGGAVSVSIGGLEEPKWPGDTVRPRVTLTNSSGHWINASSYINLTIYDPSGTAVLEDSSMSCGITSPITGACMYYDEYTLSGTASQGDWAVLVEADPQGTDTAKTSGFSVKKLALSENVSSAESEIKTNLTEEHKTTRNKVRTNVTEELKNRWQNLNASYLNGTSIERVRKLADYLNSTKWGSYIADDLYDISKKGKNISKYINKTRWINTNASELRKISSKARDLANYINETKWGDKVANDLYKISNQSKQVAQYINKTKWSNVNAPLLKRAQQDIMKEQQRTREDVRDAKRVILKSIREAVLTIFGIKKPAWLPSSSSSSSPQTPTNQTSKKLPSLPKGRRIKKPGGGTPQQIWNTIKEIYSRGVNVILYPVRQVV